MENLERALTKQKKKRLDYKDPNWRCSNCTVLPGMIRPISHFPVATKSKRCAVDSIISWFARWDEELSQWEAEMGLRPGESNERDIPKPMKLRFETRPVSTLSSGVRTTRWSRTPTTASGTKRSYTLVPTCF